MVIRHKWLNHPLLNWLHYITCDSLYPWTYMYTAISRNKCLNEMHYSHPVSYCQAVDVDITDDGNTLMTWILWSAWTITLPPVNRKSIDRGFHFCSLCVLLIFLSFHHPRWGILMLFTGYCLVNMNICLQIMWQNLIVVECALFRLDNVVYHYASIIIRHGVHVIWGFLQSTSCTYHYENTDKILILLM